MITFLISIGLLILGYFLYGRFIERFFGIKPTRKTPAQAMPDGVDYIPMPLWKVFIIEFLNIAGLGPIFGAVLGALYGPMAYIWIVLGCIFMGAVHDYFSGMLSIRNNGASLPELVGKYLGGGFQQFLRVFTILLLIFVGIAFVTGPAGLLYSFTGIGKSMWLYAIFGYYLIATLLPINKIIGRIYPFFGGALLLMAVGIAGAMIWQSVTGNLVIGELGLDSFRNFHVNPDKNLLFPMMFIVISCGAISGFHSTQAPLMARCLKSEKHGRKAFYGAMVAEGIVAMIWATAAMNFFGGPGGLAEAMAVEGHNPAWVVTEISTSWLGKVGAAFAIVGVIACPITTGDTAFRSARLTIADVFRFRQGSLKNRLIVSIPLFAVGFALSQMSFATIWKYLGLSNQILAVIVLWTAAMYLVKKAKTHWYLSLPALFLTVVCATYIFVAPHINGGLALPTEYGYPLGFLAGLIVMAIFLIRIHKIARR